MRKRLGSPYVDTLRSVYGDLSGEIDFVTYWWARSAEQVANGSVRGFGLITTKTIAQSSNRSVLSRYLDPERGGKLYLTFAIPNHPWHDQETTAAVRIAMTAAAAGQGAGRLSSVSLEKRKKGETLLEFEEQVAPINIDLTTGANVAGATSLRANGNICRMGVKMSGDGFKINTEQRARFIADGVPPERMPLVVAGTDVTESQSNTYALDFFDIETEDELHDRFPGVHRYLFDHVKPERDENDREQYRLNWWRFAEPRPRLRAAISGLRRYIVTSETATERFFKFIPSAGRLVDGSVIAIASDDPYVLGVVSSTAHTVWALRAGGRMGSGDDPRYQNETCFDPFPFPPSVPELEQRIRIAARKLDRLRRKVLARHSDLTLTALYTTLARMRDAKGGVLDPKYRSIAERGEVSLIRHYHQQIDEAVAEAYGWPRDLEHEEMLVRLVALNDERAEEERAGQIRWVRPSFQAKSLRKKPAQVVLQLRRGTKAKKVERDWPSALPEQVVAVASVVARSAKPLAPKDVARAFKGKKGTAGTLLDTNDAAIDEAPLASMLKGQTRETFSLSFSLDQDALRSGGKAMVEAKNDLGRTLFAAGSGLTGVADELKKLEGEADAIWAPTTSQRRSFTFAHRQLAEATKTIRDAALKPKSWSDARNAMLEAQAALNLARDARDVVQTELRAADRVRRLAPLVRLRDEQTETLLGYETIVDLSVQREDEAERVIREAEEAQRQRSTAEQLKADAENRRDKIEADPTLLEKADEIDQLIADGGAVAKAAQDLVRREAELVVAEALTRRLRAEAGPNADATPSPSGDDPQDRRCRARRAATKQSVPHCHGGRRRLRPSLLRPAGVPRVAHADHHRYRFRCARGQEQARGGSCGRGHIHQQCLYQKLVRARREPSPAARQVDRGEDRRRTTARLSDPRAGWRSMCSQL